MKCTHHQVSESNEMALQIHKNIKQQLKMLIAFLVISSICALAIFYINIAIKHEKDMQTLEQAVAIQLFLERFKETCGAYPAVFAQANMNNFDPSYSRGCPARKNFSSLLPTPEEGIFPEYFSQFEYCSTLTKDSRKCDDDANWKSGGYLLSFSLESDWPAGSPLRKGKNIFTPEEFFDAMREL